jgi:hypothetical protein
MTGQQHRALRYHCRLGCETIHPRFRTLVGTCSLIVTVNSGYE